MRSTPLIWSETDKRKKIRLKQFAKTMRQLQLDELLEITALASEGNVPGSGVVFGNSLIWGTHLLEIVFNLTAAESFLPSLIAGDDGYEARWQPHPDECQEAAIAKLIAAMPAVCRSLSLSDETPPDVPARIVVNQILAFCLDACVRNFEADIVKPKFHSSLHDAWLEALTGADPRVDWKNWWDLQEFAGQLNQWRRPADLNVTSHYKFCFRLNEPQESAGDWLVDYLLKPKTDQGLNLPVADFWQQDSKTKEQMKKMGGNPFEYMLTALGQASALCPEIAESLKRKNPGGFKLDAEGAFRFLREYAGSLQAAFKKNFYQPIQFLRDEETAARLKKVSSPFILRRLKTDKSIISDLPEKMEMKSYCTLTKEQASLYQAVLEDMQDTAEQAEGIDRKGLVLAMLTKLKQVCNHPAQFAGDNSSIHNRSGKLKLLLEMITEIREMKESILIFTQYAGMGSLMQEYFQEQFGEEVFFLHGSLPRKKRDIMVERFQNEDHASRIFILSLKAGGTGLNLTRANHVVHYDRWWNPAVENQATDRAFRIGQTKNVQVHKFIVAGTLEERIDAMIEMKKDVADQVLGTGEKWLSEMSNADLRELVKLGAEAVGE